jgi:GT2 family glycosyltransferase
VNELPLTRDFVPGVANDIVVVVIGRNEGGRLERCLASVSGQVRLVVYVDSGSTDGSSERARDMGAEVIDLDMSTAFTAARGRNAGLERALALHPEVQFVQFVDGDCEIEQGWLETAQDFLRRQPDVAVAFGRRKERFPDKTVYNRLCDIEWHVPAGEVRACGGDAMFRTAALMQVGGYRADLIAGEEPELCVRLRAKGWRVFSLDLPMTRHDAAMTKFSQWWQRAKRCGYAFAAGSRLHGAPPERHWVRETQRAVLWGALIPLAAIVGTLAAGPFGLLVLRVYPAQMLRLYLGRRRTSAAPLLTACFNVLARFPEALGVLRFYLDMRAGRAGSLIEYK